LCATICSFVARVIVSSGAVTIRFAQAQSPPVAQLAIQIGIAKTKNIFVNRIRPSTQVWDATVTGDGADRPIARFGCTQLILWPRS